MGEGIKLPVINGLGRTDRIDNWWAQPFWMGLALTAALVYTMETDSLPGKHFLQSKRIDSGIANIFTEHFGMESFWSQ